MENATMNEGQAPPNPPLASRVLQRPVDGRMLGGVAKALADYSAIDVTIVRILFVLLTLFGGSGIILYIACALLIPSQSTTGGPNYTTLDRLKQDRTPATIFGLLVLAVGGLVMVGTIGNNDFVLPMVLLIGGAGILLWNQGKNAGVAMQSAAPTAPSASTVAPPPPPAGTPYEPTVPMAPVDPATTAAATNPPTTPVVEQPAVQPAAPAYYQTPAGGGYEPPPTWQPPQPAPEPTPLPPKPKTRSKLTWLTLAGLAVYFGLAGFVDQTTSLNADADRTIAWGLAAVGAVLVGSAFMGRARGLILAGLVLVPAMFIASADFDGDFNGVSSEVRVVEIDLLGDDYDTGVGSAVYDFSDLDLDGETRKIVIDHDIGEVRVQLPENVALDIDARAGIGDVTVLGRNNDGPDASVTLEHTPTNNNGTLILDINLGVGEIEVTQ